MGRSPEQFGVKQPGTTEGQAEFERKEADAKRFSDANKESAMRRLEKSKQKPKGSPEGGS